MRRLVPIFELKLSKISRRMLTGRDTISITISISKINMKIGLNSMKEIMVSKHLARGAEHQSDSDGDSLYEVFIRPYIA